MESFLIGSILGLLLGITIGYELAIAARRS